MGLSITYRIFRHGRNDQFIRGMESAAQNTGRKLKLDTLVENAADHIREASTELTVSLYLGYSDYDYKFCKTLGNELVLAAVKNRTQSPV
jgi:hypothetical protein